MIGTIFGVAYTSVLRRVNMDRFFGGVPLRRVSFASAADGRAKPASPIGRSINKMVEPAEKLKLLDHAVRSA